MLTFACKCASIKATKDIALSVHVDMLKEKTSEWSPRFFCASCVLNLTV